MAARNPDSITPAQGEIHASKPRDEPMTTKGHAPGNLIGNDAIPEFHAQTVPIGTAPTDRTFTSNAVDEVPGQANNPDMDSESRTNASDTLGGATSADVHQGIGMPVYGQSSKELHGDGNYPGKKEGHGLVGVGANPRDPVRDRALDIDHPAEQKGKSGGNRGEEILGAEERKPESLQHDQVAEKAMEL